MTASRPRPAEAYLSELPEDRRSALTRVRSVVRKHLPRRFEETIQYGMISYVVPPSRYPDTYNGQALTLASVASQKGHMAVRTKALLFLSVLTALSSCKEDERGAAQQDAAVVTAASGDAGMCVREEACKDLNTSFFQYPACCSPHVACGYEINYDDAFFEVYPQARDVLFDLASDDPEGKCIPEKYVFSEKPGTYDHRVELEGPEENDILVAAQCESRGFWVFTLPGCCMPDNRCGISTDEVALTLELLLEGESAPFAKPECVTADELNAQFKASSLDEFARIPPTSGAQCDHQALAEAVPRYKRMNQP